MLGDKSLCRWPTLINQSHLPGTSLEECWLWGQSEVPSPGAARRAQLIHLMCADLGEKVDFCLKRTSDPLILKVAIAQRFVLLVQSFTNLSENQNH